MSVDQKKGYMQLRLIGYSWKLLYFYDKETYH